MQADVFLLYFFSLEANLKVFLFLMSAQCYLFAGKPVIHPALVEFLQHITSVSPFRFSAASQQKFLRKTPSWGTV